MDAIWTIEHRLWLDGADAYGEHMAPECIMAVGPMGLLQGEAIVEGLRGAPRWSSVTMDNRTEATLGNVLVIGYVAEGRRDGAEPYRALCTSSYAQTTTGWKIVQHQQTPI